MNPTRHSQLPVLPMAAMLRLRSISALNLPNSPIAVLKVTTALSVPALAMHFAMLSPSTLLSSKIHHIADDEEAPEAFAPPPLVSGNEGTVPNFATWQSEYSGCNSLIL